MTGFVCLVFRMRSKTMRHSTQGRLFDIIKDKTGGAALRFSLLFGVAAIALALLVTPQLKKAADNYAENKALGIDRTLTGSVDDDQGQERKPRIKIYHIRKSVLDQQ